MSSPHPSWHAITESMTHWGRKCTCHFDPSICEAPEGMHHNFWYTRVGHNLEMSELNACFGRFQLQSWTSMESSRIKYYEILYEKLKNLNSLRGSYLLQLNFFSLPTHGKTIWSTKFCSKFARFIVFLV